VSGVSCHVDFSFGTTALVLLPVAVLFFVGAGPSIHNLGGDVDYYGFSVSSDSLTRVGVRVLGGSTSSVALGRLLRGGALAGSSR
jgi:hypothetical protein